MNVKSVVFALVFACSVTAGAHLLIRQSSMEPPPHPTKQVVQISARIDRGQMLTKSDLKLVQVDASAVPPGAILDLQVALGRAARSTILPGILLETQLMQLGGSGLPALISVGRVAHTIKVPKASSGLLPFLRPKDRVDVQLILNAQASSGGRQARVSRVVPLLTNVEVLAVGTRLSDYLDEEDDRSHSKKAFESHASSIALLLTRRQSMQLGLGESKGELLITLRNPRNAKTNGPETKEVTWNDLLGDEADRDANDNPPTAPTPPPAAAPIPNDGGEKPRRANQAKIVVYYGTRRHEHAISVPETAAVSAIPQMQQVKVP